MTHTDFGALIAALASEGVEFVLIGGLAAAAHGSARFTSDVDVLYRRSPDNHARIVRALAPLSPYLRGAPPDLPFQWDVETVRRGLNFTLATRVGAIDLLAEIPGCSGYEAALSESQTRTLYGREVRVLGLDALIRVKRAAGRPKDLEAVAELETLWEEANSDEIPVT